MDGQEVIRIAAVADQPELLGQHPADLIGNALGEAPHRGLDDEVFEPRHRLPSVRHRFVRILVAELVEGEADAGEQPGGFVGRRWAVAEQAPHLGRGLEVAVAVGGEAPAGRLHRHALADAGDDVVQLALLGRGVERVVGGEQRHACRACDLRQPRQPTPVPPPARHGRSEPHVTGRGGGKAGERGDEVGGWLRRSVGDDQAKVRSSGGGRRLPGREHRVLGTGGGRLERQGPGGTGSPSPYPATRLLPVRNAGR